MVAAPFLAMVFAIIETAIVFFAGQALETAAADSARLIMTGQAQTQGLRPGQVQAGGVRQDLRPVQLQRRPLRRREELLVVRQRSHRQADHSNGNLQTGNFGYQPGGPGDIVVVRLMYQWPVYVSLLGLNSPTRRRQAPADVHRRVPQRAVSVGMRRIRVMIMHRALDR